MEVIVAAALIAIAVVVAAVMYGRTHSAAPAPVAPPAPDNSATATALQAALAERGSALERREDTISRREAELDQQLSELANRRVEAERTLERLAGMSGTRAKELLLQEIEDQAKHDSARRIRQIEEETKREAERRVRNILSVVMQRLAGGHAAETTVSVVHLASDDLKGRIIGREGRNIRARENRTRHNFIYNRH